MTTVDLIALAVIAPRGADGLPSRARGRRPLARRPRRRRVIGARLAPAFLPEASRAYTPLVALGGAVRSASSGTRRGDGRQRAPLEPPRAGAAARTRQRRRAVLGAVTGLALVWAVGAVALLRPRPDGAPARGQDSAILPSSTRLPPARLMDALARIDPFAAIAGPAAARRRARPGAARRDGRPPRGAQRRPRDRRRVRARHRRLRLGRRAGARRHERARRRRDGGRHASTAPTASPATPTSSPSTRATTSPCSASRARRAAAPARRSRRGTAAAMLGYPGQRPVHGDGRARRPPVTCSPRRVRPLPGPAERDDDPRARPARQLGRPRRRRAGPRAHDGLRRAHGTAAATASRAIVAPGPRPRCPAREVSTGPCVG